MAKKFLLTREKREMSAIRDTANRESFVAAVRETAAINARRGPSEHAVAGSTRHVTAVRCVNTACNPSPSTRVRCKQTTKAHTRGLPHNI